MGHVDLINNVYKLIEPTWSSCKTDVS